MKKTYVLLGLLLMAALLTGGFAYQNYLEKQAEKQAQEQWLAHMTETVERDTFYEGIVLDDVPLGGMTLQEASERFEKAEEELLANFRAELVYEDQSWVFTSKDIMVRTDWREKLDELYQLARQGELSERYNEVEEIRDKGVRMDTTLTMDVSLIYDDIVEIAESLYIEPIDADVSFFPDKKEKFSFSPEKDGQRVDAESLYEEVKQIFDSGKPGTVVIEPIPVEAQVRLADLEKATSRIVSFHTDMAGSSSNRMHNIELALRKINGTKLNPGEVFSFNGIVGRRTEKAGFREAPVIAADKSMKDAVGGGICQASSTVFNAAALAGLEIVERYHHSFPISYLDKGLDATVSYGGADLKFRNNKNTPVFIQAYRNGTLAYVVIYGEPIPNNGQYKLVTELLQTIEAPEPKRVLDKKGEYVTKPGGEYVHVKSRTGYKVNTYRLLYENGKRVSKELFVRNYYQPIQGVIYYREGKPEPTPGPTPEPTKAPKDPDTKPTDPPEPTSEPSQEPSTPPDQDPVESPDPESTQEPDPTGDN